MSLPYTTLLFWISPMIFAILSEIAADFIGKKWTLKNRHVLFVASISFYIIVNVFWIVSVFNGAGLGRGAIVFAVGQQIAAISLGIIYFKEKLNRVQFVGAILGLITIAIMGVV
jgi:hypothetical protein